MKQFAKAGDFCPKEACPDYGKLQGDQQHNRPSPGLVDRELSKGLRLLGVEEPLMGFGTTVVQR
jgi:hypothetical protein